MYCRNCGTELKQNEKFCKNCGKATAVSDVQSIEKKKHSRVIPLLCVILVVLVVCIVYLAVNNSGSSPILKKSPSYEDQLKIILKESRRRMLNW